MAWIAPTGSSRSPRHERNSMIGLVYSPSTSIQAGLQRPGNRKPSRHFAVKDEFEEEDLRDDLFNTNEKKKRLTADQVKFLEMSFGMDLKLEPERKALLAKQLGIRPRQVAIWFQNRRARWKNKQLEQDFENLKAEFETLMKEKEKILLDHGMVLEDNKRLQAEVLCLQDLLERTRISVLSDTAGAGSDGKSELTSPTKSSVDQCDMQDSCQSYPLVGAMGMEAIVPTDWEFNPVNMKTDIEHAPMFLGDEFFGPSHPTVLVHSVAASGIYLEDGVYSNCGGGQFNGMAYHYDSASY